MFLFQFGLFTPDTCGVLAIVVVVVVVVVVVYTRLCCHAYQRVLQARDSRGYCLLLRIVSSQISTLSDTMVSLSLSVSIHRTMLTQ